MTSEALTWYGMVNFFFKKTYFKGVRGKFVKKVPILEYYRLYHFKNTQGSRHSGNVLRHLLD